MIVIQAPKEKYSVSVATNKKLFLAGGISGCCDWQTEFIKELKKHETSNDFVLPITLYNPRRKNFNQKCSEEQIVWEFVHLRDSDIVVFWFAKETLCPITLYELGMWGNSKWKDLIIGVQKGYKRAEDVYIQTQLARPEVKHIYTCETSTELAFKVYDFLRGEYV